MLSFLVIEDPEICAAIDRVNAEGPVLRTDHTMNPYPPPPPEFLFAFCASLHGISC